MIQNHHTRMLGTTKLVELVVISCAELENSLAIVEMLALLDIVYILCVILQVLETHRPAVGIETCCHACRDYFLLCFLVYCFRLRFPCIGITSTLIATFFDLDILG